MMSGTAASLSGRHDVAAGDLRDFGELAHQFEADAAAFGEPDRRARSRRVDDARRG